MNKIKSKQLFYPRKEVKQKISPLITSELIEEEVEIKIIKPRVNKWRWQNFTPKNIYYALQGSYRKWIVKQYNKFSKPELASRILEFESCLGSHPSCGCPMVEVLLSNKPFEKC